VGVLATGELAHRVPLSAARHGKAASRGAP
jgi:hypothetical protein